MPREIERKFICTDLPDLTKVNAAKIWQGYLSRGNHEVRIRRTQWTARIEYEITIKHKVSDLTRKEVSAAISEQTFNTLKDGAIGSVSKTRYYIGLDNHTAELDVFLDRDLTLVEVEFNSETEAQAFDPPSWFGSEVTTNPNYSNAQLSTQ